jgi:hypothetical protein
MNQSKISFPPAAPQDREITDRFVPSCSSRAIHLRRKHIDPIRLGGTWQMAAAPRDNCFPDPMR